MARSGAGLRSASPMVPQHAAAARWLAPICDEML